MPKLPCNVSLGVKGDVIAEGENDIHSFAATPSVPEPWVDPVISKPDLVHGPGSPALPELSDLSPEGRDICRWMEAALQRHHAALLKAYKPPWLAEEEAGDKLKTLSMGSLASSPLSQFAPKDTNVSLITKINPRRRRRTLTYMQDIMSRHSMSQCPQSEPHRLTSFVLSKVFERLSILLLTSNTIFIGFQVELSFLAEMPAIAQVIDVIFAILFVVEVSLRVWAFGCKMFFCGPGRGWNMFDAIVVTLSAIEVTFSTLVPTSSNSFSVGNLGIIRVVRAFRLLRVLRIMRVLKFFKDVRILLLAVAHTMSTAAWAFLLTFLCMYMFGIAITQMVADYVKEQQALGYDVDRDSKLVQHFSTIIITIETLFMSISGGLSWEVATHALGTINPLAEALFFAYIMFTAFCMLNVIIGIFCKNAVEVFENDKERMIETQLSEKSRYMDNLAGMFNEWDTSGDGFITLDEFREHLGDRHMQAFLESMGVSPRDALQLFELMDMEDGCVDSRVELDGFVTGCLTLQSTAKAVHTEQMLLNLKLLEEKITSIHRQLSSMGQHFNLKPVRL